MTVGCAGAMNAALKAILDPGDEVIVCNPFFPDYQFYITNHGGRMVPVETDEDFSLDVPAIESKITPTNAGDHPELAEQSDRRHLFGSMRCGTSKPCFSGRITPLW